MRTSILPTRMQHIVDAGEHYHALDDHDWDVAVDLLYDDAIATCLAYSHATAHGLHELARRIDDHLTDVIADMDAIRRSADDILDIKRDLTRRAIKAHRTRRHVRGCMHCH